MILEVENGSFAYRNNEVLCDVDLQVDDHDILAILGRNGAGKTTLLKCIMGMLSWQKGSTKLNGKSICEIDHKDLWKTISMCLRQKEAAIYP